MPAAIRPCEGPVRHPDLDRDEIVLPVDVLEQFLRVEARDDHVAVSNDSGAQDAVDVGAHSLSLARDGLISKRVREHPAEDEAAGEQDECARDEECP